MNAHILFVTLNLPSKARRLGAMGIGVAAMVLWINVLGMQTFAMALFALSIIALFEVQKFFNRTQELSDVAVDKAVGAAYASYIALSVMPNITGIFGISVALLLFWYFDTHAPSSIGWLRRRLANGFGLVLSTLLGAIAAGLGGALVNTVLGTFV